MAIKDEHRLLLDQLPKTIKIFQNLTKSLDFDSAESMAGSQEFE
jgi:flagellin-specific chaperone FliS